ncbi:hypothetical protein AcV7_001182 [Taiwanofungus camphoratus]|nr:hypothetical protein AcV7_001182 [Antrodia cinnamomea]
MTKADDRTTAEHTPSNDRGNHEHSSHDSSPASSSRSLVISYNLHAALEYDEKTRLGALGTTVGPAAGGGLPPPPRPKSRTRSAKPSSPISPATSTDHSPASVPNSPTTSPYRLSPSTAGASASNPYINPVPRLSYLRHQDSILTVGGDSQASPDAVSTDNGAENNSRMNLSVVSVRLRDDPRISQAPPPSPSSPQLEESPNDGPRSSPRHYRGLSSLQRVEKMLGKSKNALNVLSGSESSLRCGRRVSDADLQTSRFAEKTGKDALIRQYRRMLDRGKPTSPPPSSAPGSPIDGSKTSSLPPSSRAVVPSSPTAAVASPGQASPMPRRGSVLSHARAESHMSQPSTRSMSPSSDSTHEPLSTPTETHISISSTIYSSNQHSFDPSQYRSLGRSSMNTDRESFIDMTSPTSPPPHSPDFPQYAQMERPAYSGAPLTLPASPVSYTSQDLNSFQYSVSSTKPTLSRLTTTTSSEKPPLPTTPKPNFRRSRSAQPPSERSRSDPTKKLVEGSAPDMERNIRHVPSTTNLLPPEERAERIRKTRKLTQVFGRPPGVATERYEDDTINVNGCLPVPGALAQKTSKRKHHKQAASMLDDPMVPLYVAHNRIVWPPAEGTHVHRGARRYSTPLSPQEFPSMGRPSAEDGHSVSTISGEWQHVIEIGTQEGVPFSDWESENGYEQRAGASGSPTSFIDLSDGEASPDAVSDLLFAETPKLHPRLTSPLSPTTPSILDSLSSEQQAEEDRRRKREQLAKLHRFLGSRVPTHLVLGPLEEGVPLPPPASASPSDCVDEGGAGELRKIRVRRRRSSSAAEMPGTWSDDIDRLKEELNEREKAINVRRAVKMEKMFGVAPPQKLYHTRQAVSSPGSSVAAAGAKPWQPPSSPKHPSHSPSSSISRNLNQSAYKGKSKKNGRPGTAESAKPLLSPTGNDSEPDLIASVSNVYLHYRHSLNSLNDIIDRDDKQSLAELHDYLSGNRYDGVDDASPPDDLISISSPTKAERRRSLPSRTSMMSVSSEWTLGSPEDSTFQRRRRRAAKLTQFFGVNYRDLMSEILDSIEKGLEEERGKGTLKPDEIQDLLQKLVKLKTKRNNLSLR